MGNKQLKERSNPDLIYERKKGEKEIRLSRKEIFLTMCAVGDNVAGKQ